jgi:hypothetical protein
MVTAQIKRVAELLPLTVQALEANELMAGAALRKFGARLVGVVVRFLADRGRLPPGFVVDGGRGAGGSGDVDPSLPAATPPPVTYTAQNSAQKGSIFYQQRVRAATALVFSTLFAESCVCEACDRSCFWLNDTFLKRAALILTNDCYAHHVSRLQNLAKTTKKRRYGEAVAGDAASAGSAVSGGSGGGSGGGGGGGGGGSSAMIVDGVDAASTRVSATIDSSIAIIDDDDDDDDDDFVEPPSAKPAKRLRA